MNKREIVKSIADKCNLSNDAQILLANMDPNKPYNALNLKPLYCKLFGSENGKNDVTHIIQQLVRTKSVYSRRAMYYRRV